MNSASSSSGPRFSVVIVTYNSRDNIQVCLDSLRRCSGRAGGASSPPDHEIIVVDNDSRDATPDYLSRQEGVMAVLNKENVGFSKGCNLGAAKAKGEFLIFLNPDTLVTPGWSEAMAQYFKDPATGAAGPLSNYVAGLQRIDLHLPAPYDKGGTIPGNGATEQSENVARIIKEANAGRGVTTKLLIGFCLMIRRDLFNTLGGMDENLFLGNDDLDLSWRLRNRGLKLVVATDAFVFHEGQKSFKTEAKTHVDRLVQESTDALYLKLIGHYGGRDKVPSSQELWGMGWFSPSPDLLKGGNDHSRKAEASMATETQKATAWKGVTALIFLGPGQPSGSGAAADASDEAGRLDRTLSSLPERPSDVILINCSTWSGPIARQPEGGFRRLDLGAGCSARAALELTTALAQEHLLFCAAGVGFSALFNHWLEKRLGLLPSPLPLSIRGEGDNSAAGETYPGCAFLCRKAWLREALDSMSSNLSMTGNPAEDAAVFLASLGERIAQAAAAQRAQNKPSDPPWLLARPADLPLPKRQRSWTPVKSAPDAVSAASAPATEASRREKAIANYPESLGNAMRSARDIAFAGTVADLLPVKGSFHVFDIDGARVPFGDQDLVILRVTPDHVDAMVDRLVNLRRQGRNLKRLMVVLNSRQALRKPQGEGGFLPAIDVTAEGVRAALWESGFAVVSEQPYKGFPPVDGSDGNLDGWTLLEASPRSPALKTEKKVSIVILGFNQVEYTKKCIESIRKHTRQAYELVLVDNGSKDGTEEFFRSIPGAKVIRNDENQGVSKGWNQGMRLADGDYFLIFNNDTIVGPGWLENMVRLCESDVSIGMVGPRSNYIAGPQIVTPVPYKTEPGIQDFIAEWQGEHDLSADEFGFIKGFCLLIPRPVFDKVGFFDERFGKGNFEDDDYSLRVRYHGYRTLIANDSFIHHYGSVSFNQESVDWKALMAENQQKYVKKWSRGSAALYDTVVSDPVPAKAGPDGLPPEIIEGRKAYAAGDLDGASRHFLAAQALHPDHAEPYCGLGVIAFHRGVHMDAGSLFLKCLELDPSHEDAATNLMDVLDILEQGLPPGDVAALSERFPGNPSFAAALGSIASRLPAASSLATSAPGPAPKPLAPWRSDIEAMIGRREYGPALDLLEKRLKAGQDVAVCYNYMGVIAHACGDRECAADSFRNAMDHRPEADAVHNFIDTLLATGKAEEAFAVLLNPPAMDAETAVEADLATAAEQIIHAVESGRPDGERLIASREANQQAEKLLRTNEPAKARDILMDALAKDGRDFRALNNLGLAEWYLGRVEEAWKRFRACLAIRPAWTDALINGFDAALAAGRIAEFGPCIDAALSAERNHQEALRMAAHIEREGNAIQACRGFAALEEDALLLGRADKAMQEGRKIDAIKMFLESMDKRSRNPQALNGLGIIAFSDDKHVDAYALFDAAAALHPMDQDILVNLWQAAQALRREVDVLPKLKTSLARNPALHDVKAILENA